MKKVQNTRDTGLGFASKPQLCKINFIVIFLCFAFSCLVDANSKHFQYIKSIFVVKYTVQSLISRDFTSWSFCSNTGWKFGSFHMYGYFFLLRHVCQNLIVCAATRSKNIKKPLFTFVYCKNFDELQEFGMVFIKERQNIYF